MAKQMVTITVDADVIEEIRKLRINISGEINSYLSSLLARYNEDVEGINIRLERINLENAMKKMTHWQGIAKKSQTLIQKWEEIQQDKEKAKLEKEKAEIESISKCQQCGQMLTSDHKAHAFAIGSICHACYLNGTKELIAKWMKPLQKSSQTA